MLLQYSGLKGVNEYFCSEVGEGGAETGNIPEVEELCTGDVADVGFKGDSGVHCDAKVFALRGRE